MSKMWKFGVGGMTFTPVEGTALVMTKTQKSQDVKMTYTTERDAKYSDQQSAPEEDGIISEILLVNTNVPLDYAELIVLTNEWVAGSTGYALKSNMGGKPVEGELKILKKGGTTGTADEYVMNGKMTKVNLDMSFKVDGDVLVPIEFTAYPDADDIFIKTGDYVEAV